MSDDLDFDMEVVGDDDLGDLGIDSAASSTKPSRTEEQSKSNNDNFRAEDMEPSNAQSDGSDPEYSKRKPDRLGEYVEFKNGKKPNRVLEEATDNAEAYLTVETLRDGELKYAIDESAPRASPHDVLMIMDGSGSGRVYRGREGIISSTFSALEISQLSPEYVRYFLEHNFRRINSATKGSAVPHTDKDLVRSLEIPNVKIDEQRKIASVLYAVDQAIQKTEAIIEQAKRVKRGLVQDLLCRGIDSEGKLRSVRSANFRETRLGKFPESWKLKQLRSLTTESITYGIVQPGPDTPGGVPFIRSGDATGGRLEPDSLQRTTEEIAESYSRSRVNAGEIITTIRATVGESHQVPASLDGANLGRGVARIVPTEEIDNRFLLWTMRSGYMERQFKMYMKGSTYSEITLEQLGKLKVALPESGEQKRISGVLDMQEKKIRNEQDRIGHLNRLKRGLMQDILTGEVRTADKAIDVLDEVVEHG